MDRACRHRLHLPRASRGPSPTGATDDSRHRGRRHPAAPHADAVVDRPEQHPQLRSRARRDHRRGGEEPDARVAREGRALRRPSPAPCRRQTPRGRPTADARSRHPRRRRDGHGPAGTAQCPHRRPARSTDTTEAREATAAALGRSLAVLLLRMSPQPFDQGPRRHPGRGRHRLPRHGPAHGRQQGRRHRRHHRHGGRRVAVHRYGPVR